MRTTRRTELRILQGTNPYAQEVQGKANEPICVAMLLDRARMQLNLPVEATLEEIYDRLEYNAPRVAVITGSPDHPAHVMDHETVLKAAAAIWNRGGVPFAFGIPVICDGTAQSTQGMCYSLVSRNLVCAMVINQMEGHSYHGAFVIQGCDKTPAAIVSALASLDVTRRARGEAPVFATFAPAHVLRGGTIPDDLKRELSELADAADRHNLGSIGEDIRHTLRHILQCSSNQAFQGVFKRAVQAGLLTPEKHKDFEKRLAVNTCDPRGGICAFHGTGNSSRDLVSSLGLVHPAVELLTNPPTFEQVDQAVSALLAVCNDPAYSVSNLVIQNIENAVRVHSTLGGSTNIMLHLVACAIYAGCRFSIHDYDRIRRQVPVPDLMDYSLTEGRDIFAWARQCCEGRIGGIDTVLHELRRNQVPVTADAPTMAGKTWAERLKNGRRLAAGNVKDNPIILSTPRRATSGVDVLSGNFFESAVVKISGLPDEQVDEFDEKVAVVLYFETEEQATAQLLNVNILRDVARGAGFPRDVLLGLYRHNTGKNNPELERLRNKQMIFQRILDENALRLAVVIAGQGPEAFGMPEMFTPTQHINHNRELKKIVTIISDGRYSGVTYGAAVGHVTPESFNRGGILYLQTGDLLHLRLRRRQIHLLDAKSFAQGKLRLYTGSLAEDRGKLGEQRLARLRKRRASIDPSNLMSRITDAAHGAVPLEVWERARQIPFLSKVSKSIRNKD
ncbi:MAG: dihydroxy-acid dehydratase [Candidatus Omnitrophica bacterium]|nr:dihydroxy-acid dehydratase [Candidatus Omnitrophota bacterium]